jgi:hypothetical protein
MVRHSAALFALATLLAVPRSASASLGADASSITADRISMQGALLRISQADAFTVHEVQSATGTAIREYVSPSGTVFAVAWTGPYQPDLRQLFGAYFDRFQAAAAAARRAHRGRGPLAIDDGEVSVQIVGHPRFFSGIATVKRLMPASVRADRIR